MTPICPDCHEGKHRNCVGRAWDVEADRETECACECRHPRVIVNESPPPVRSVLDPCSLGRHRWAYLVDGRQACGYCGGRR